MKLLLTKTANNRRSAFIENGDEFFRVALKTNKIVKRTKRPAGDVVSELVSTPRHIKNIVDLGYAYRPDVWTLPPATITRLIKTNEKLTKSIRTIFKKRRELYSVREIDPADLTDDQISNLCKNKIRMKYIKNKFASPENKVLIARRDIHPCVPPRCFYTLKKTCKRPDVLNVFRSIKPSVSYEEFVASLPKTDRNDTLCSMLHREHIGALCVYSESEDDVIVYILCSNRSLGKKLLDHLALKNKPIVIDSPLDDAVSFYIHLGWGWIRGKDAMIRHPSISIHRQMATQDARLTALQIVWDHWTKDDIIARRKEFHANRIARISGWLGGRLRFDDLMIYIDMYNAGFIDDMDIVTYIMNVGWYIKNDKIPYGTCPKCRCSPFMLECYSDDDDTLANASLSLTCSASSCGYYEDIFHV